MPYGQKGDIMFNLHKKKAQRIVSAVIIIILVLAMVLPTLAYLV